MQKITIPNLLIPSTDRTGAAAKASILRDPPAVLTRKRSTALPPLDVCHTSPGKRDVADHQRKGLLCKW